MKDIGQIVKAIASAMVGVGKKEDLIKNLERTEKQGPQPYIVVGLIMTVGFIVMIIVIVKLVLP